MHNAGIEPGSLRAHADRHSGQLSHTGIYCHIIKGLMMTSDGLLSDSNYVWSEVHFILCYELYI